VMMAGGRLYLTPSSLKPGEIARVLREGYSVNRLGEGMQELVRHLKLDYLFIDTHPGMNEETLLAMALSDVLVLVLRPDRQDFQGTAVTVEVAKKLNVSRLLLVVNKALSSMDPARLKQEVESAYCAPVAAVLPLTEDMMELASGGVFVLHYPNHPLTEMLKRLARVVLSGG
jgi:septum site-determining protein MinD